MPEPRDHLSLPMDQWTADERREYVDSHIVMALEAADLTFGTAADALDGRQQAEDYVRDRLVAISDTFPDAAALAAERKDAANRRVLRVIGLRL